MASDKIHCDQTCKGICTSLEAASAAELKAITLYTTLRNQCTYPEIQEMLDVLIEKRRELIKLIDDTQVQMKQKFEVLDQIRESFTS
ncbi:MAG: hypothetical protein ACHQQQ_14475 [Bacteroidota bacterium]